MRKEDKKLDVSKKHLVLKPSDYSVNSIPLVIKNKLKN